MPQEPFADLLTVVLRSIFVLVHSDFRTMFHRHPSALVNLRSHRISSDLYKCARMSQGTRVCESCHVLLSTSPHTRTISSQTSHGRRSSRITYIRLPELPTTFWFQSPMSCVSGTNWDYPESG